MSDNKPLVPTTDDGKNSYYLVVVPYINRPANQLRFNSSVGNLGIMNTKYALWGLTGCCAMMFRNVRRQRPI